MKRGFYFRGREDSDYSDYSRRVSSEEQCHEETSRRALGRGIPGWDAEDKLHPQGLTEQLLCLTRHLPVHFSLLSVYYVVS
jgi:hypothetical protein